MRLLNGSARLLSEWRIRMLNDRKVVVTRPSGFVKMDREAGGQLSG